MEYTVARTRKDAWVAAGIAGSFVLAMTGYAQNALGDATRSAVDAAGADLFTAFVTFLRSTGPLGAAVLAGWWALRKDREKNELAATYQAQMKEMYDQVVGLVSAQTAAMTKMEGTISALRDAIMALRSDDREER